MRTKRWSDDDGVKWYELREDGTFHSYKGVKLKIHDAKGSRFVVCYLTINGEHKRIYLPMRKTMVKYFVDNPNNYKFARFIDGNVENFHYKNLEPVKTFFESLTDEAKESVLEGQRQAELTRINKERAKRKKKETPATEALLQKVKQDVAYKAKIKRGKLPPSSIAERDRRTKEKYMGYMPKVGLFGKKLLKEEPKYDSNFKLR